MKILYITPEHVSGTLPLWVKEHERHGNECRYVTLFPNHFNYPEDICLFLPLHPDKMWLWNLRKNIYRLTHGPQGQDTPIEEKPPYWRPKSIIHSSFFEFRDKLIEPIVKNAIKDHNLNGFDIIQLDQGAGFLRNGKFIKKWKEEGKKIVTFYHGSDMRNRGIFPNIDEITDLRLTCELDLLYLDERLKYLFLPFDTSKWQRDFEPESKTIKIVHGARNLFKGTQEIIKTVEKLKEKYPVELVLIQGVTHDVAMKMKSDCHIAIDQLADSGGWGYGMSGVEYLSYGIPTITRMNDEYKKFIPDYPFIDATFETLEAVLIKLITDREYRISKGNEGREWVVKNHDIKSVGDQLYKYYAEFGLID